MGTIDIFYSPITKQYKFKRDGRESDFDIESWQKVNNATKKEGKYKFLQELSINFFDALYEVCYGTSKGKTVEINIQSTEEVYEDLKRMIDNYNDKLGKTDRNIRLGRLIEMESNEKVQNFISEKINETKNLLMSLDLNDFDSSVGETITNHIEKIKKLLKLDSSENVISLCVTGVYSTGKSTFINALIGEELLESEDDPTTASVYSIIKSTENDPIKIEFIVENPNLEKISLVYKDEKFISEREINNQKIRDELLSEISSSKTCIEQIHFITKFINEKIKNYSEYLDSKKEIDDDNYSELIIDTNVNIYYPFTIGGDIPVKICDTPGTNSSFRADKSVIEKALSEEKNSILLTLIHPGKSDDAAGHDILFNILDRAEQENVYIDKSRLFFIWNQIDGKICRKENIEKKKSDIIKVRDDNGKIKSINLSEYPLFFMSSFKALVANNLLKNPEDEQLRQDYEDTNVRVNLSEECSYGWQTEKFKESAQKELEKTENEYKKALIMSGLYSVEKGINDYINKYAGAIISNGLYEKIKEINTDLVREIKSVEEKQKQIADGKVEEFEKKEEHLKSLVKTSCDEESKRVNGEIFDSMNAEYEDNIVKYIEYLYKKKYKHSTWKGEKTVSDLHFTKTTEILEKLVRKDLEKYITALFEKYREKRIKDRETIFNNITNKLNKEFEEGIGTENWEKIKKKVLEDINDSEKKDLRFEDKVNLIFWNKIKSKEFIVQAKKFVIDNTVSIQESIKNYPQDMKTIIDSIGDDYQKNLENYSKSLLELKNNREKEMEKYHKVQKLNKEISEIIKQIDEKINPNE